MSRSYRTNDAGIEVNTQKNQDGSITVTRAEGSSANSQPARNLPADQQVDNIGTINFFGSSFSGSDIRLVAHLYADNTTSDKRREVLESEIELTQQILEGYNLVLSELGNIAALPTDGPLGNPNATSVGLAAALSGLTNATARRIVINSLNTAQIRASTSLTRLHISKFQSSYRNLLSSQEDKLNALDQIEYEAFDTVELGTLQTISVQSHREKRAVRALGHSYAKGYSRGPRTIAGSLIFTIFHEHALRKLIHAMGDSTTFGELDPEISTLIPDQLPPIDFTLIFANEYGQISEQRLYGVEFVNDGVGYSIEDIYSEQVLNFVCRDVDVLTPKGRIPVTRLQRQYSESPIDGLNASELLFNNREYENYLDRLSIRRRLRNR